MALIIVLICLATFRLTRLVVSDAFPPTEAMREWVKRRTGDESSWSYLSTCPWCVSMYAGAAVTVGADWWAGSVRAPLLVILTASVVSGILATFTP